MTNNKVAVLGSGQVGDFLSNGFLKHGYEVMRGSRDPKKLDDWKTKAANPKATTGTFAEAAKYGDIIVLAVKGKVAQELLEGVGADAIANKVILDTTNPIDESAKDGPVIRYFTPANDSLMEQLQKKFPSAKFVKCFNSVGSPFMVNPDFGGTKPTMFICGNDSSAKEQTKSILDKFGWETEDMGPVESARALESLCILWCIPGFLRNQWGHAFKLLKK
jgi:8-hydroxy-5-deazaflavin:NADPH oxidoreductase